VLPNPLIVKRLILLLLCFVLAAGAVQAQPSDPLTLVSPGLPAPSNPAPVAPAEAMAAPLVYHAADEMPDFPGGATALAKFLRAKISYPAAALNHGTSGKVHVSFVVDEQGRLLDPKVVKGLGFGLDEEALRLVRIMPWWTPGRIQGQPVRVAYTLPIVFRALE
jgi:protein TonB